MSVKGAPAPSVGQDGARVTAAVAGQRSAMPAICGLVFVMMIEAAWVGLLFFVALRLIVR